MQLYKYDKVDVGKRIGLVLGGDGGGAGSCVSAMKEAVLTVKSAWNDGLKVSMRATERL